MAPTMTRRTQASTALTVPQVHGTLLRKGDTSQGNGLQRVGPNQVASQAAQGRKVGSGGFKGPALTPDEAAVLLCTVAPESAWGTFLRFLWQGGARVSEALQVTRSDVNLQGECVRVETKKQHPNTDGSKKPPKYRRVYFGPDLKGFLALHMSVIDTKPGTRLWPWTRQHAWRMVGQLARRAGIDPSHCHPHAFRHGLAMNLMNQGVPMPVVSRVLGHADIKTTGIYLQVGDDLQRSYIKGVTF